jgi:hypothetical protein
MQQRSIFHTFVEVLRNLHPHLNGDQKRLYWRPVKTAFLQATGRPDGYLEKRRGMDDPHAFPILPLTFAPANSLDSELLLPITFALVSAEEDHTSLEEDIADVATAIPMHVLMSQRSDTLFPPSSESVAELEVGEESIKHTPQHYLPVATPRSREDEI